MAFLMKRIFTLPYPIDLQMFKPELLKTEASQSSSLRVCWLGRIIPLGKQAP